jgi:hypothetical protein
MGIEKTLKNTISGLLILSLLLFFLGLIAFKTLFPNSYFWFFPLLILFFLLVNAGFFVFFYRSLKKSGAHFVRSFMATTVVKLVVFMVLILAYIISSPATAIPFAVTLSVLYIAYTAYDLFIMLTLLKQKKEINT